MRHLILLCLFFCFGQAVHAQIPDHIICDSAKKVCEVGDEAYNLTENDEYCTQPLYYYFHSSTLATNAVLFHSEGSGGNISLYHMHSDGFYTGFCDQVELGTATLIGSDDFDTYENVTLPFSQTGIYMLKVVHDSCFIDPFIGPSPVTRIAFSIFLETMEGITCPDIQSGEPGPDCKNCISSFSPAPGRYMVSAWVSEDGASINTVSYTNASIGVTFTDDPATYNLTPTGRIIDGWQQIQQMIEIPSAATEIHLALQSNGVDTYFDDIRFYPLDGSMTSYVYDPHNLRMMAQLDERNYATFFEYDEEGKLIRVKKETERGVMTIQENRDNTRKE